MNLLRPDIARMAPYTPGEQPQGGGFVKLNTNENPYPPSPRVLEALRREIGPALRLYPDPLATPLRRAAAERFGVAPECVLAGNGSDELLTLIMRAFVGPGERVAYPTPTYTLYRTLAQIQGAQPIEVPFPDDYSLPPDLSRAGAKAVFLANPNSPSGTLVAPEAVSALATALSGLLVVDEAYVDFAAAHCLDLIGRHRNLIVLRTLSKSFSLCGVRCGLAFAPPDLIAGLMKVKDSYNVNRLAIAAGVAALEDIGGMQQNARKIVATRERLRGELEAMGFSCWPSQANFVLARAPRGRRARDLYEALKRRKILVRWFDAPRVDDCLRITVGTDAETDALLAALREVL